MERRELSYTVGGTINWCSHYKKKSMKLLKKTKIKSPYDPAIPLLGLYLDKTII